MFCMTWSFGEYIQKLLDQKGWSAARLAKETGLSHTYIGHLIKGEASGKPGPPSPTIDVLITLSKALNASEASLILAYQGKDPEQVGPDFKQHPDYKGAAKAFFASLPPEVVLGWVKEFYQNEDKK